MAKILGDGGAIPTDGATYSRNRGSGKTITEKYVGEYSALKAKENSAGLGSKAYASTSLVKTEGGTGELVLTKIVPDEESSGSAGEMEPKANWEMTMSELRLPLAAHPNFPKSHLGCQWPCFLASPVQVQAQMKYLTDPNDPNSYQQTVSPDLEEWCELYNKGISDYATYAPIVVKVQVYDSQPTPSDVGKIDTPAKWASLASSWLKTADNISFDGGTGMWTRSQQWTGAGEWPEVLYGGNGANKKSDK